MGIRLWLFAEDIPSALICGGCEEVLQDPVVSCDLHFCCATCFKGKTYCLQPGCINRRCARSVPAKSVGKIVDLLRRVCPYGGRECDWTGTREMVFESRYPGNHKAECQYLMIDCPHPDCEERTLRKDMPAHEVACPHRIVDCRLACPARYAAKDEAAHLQVCPKVVVACPRSCGQDLERGKLTDHEGECVKMVIDCPRGCPASFERGAGEEHGAECAWWPCTATIGCPTRTQKAHLTEHEEHCHAQAALAREAADELDAARDEVAALKKQLADMQKAAGAAPSASPVPLSDAASPPDAAGIEAAEDLFRRATSASPDDVKEGINDNNKADLDQLGGEDDPNEEDAVGNDGGAPQPAHDVDDAADLVEDAASDVHSSDVPLPAPARHRRKRMAPLENEDDKDDLAPAQRRRIAIEEELTDEE